MTIIPDTFDVYNHDLPFSLTQDIIFGVETLI